MTPSLRDARPALLFHTSAPKLSLMYAVVCLLKFEVPHKKPFPHHNGKLLFSSLPPFNLCIRISVHVLQQIWRKENNLRCWFSPSALTQGLSICFNDPRESSCPASSWISSMCPLPIFPQDSVTTTPRFTWFQGFSLGSSNFHRQCFLH